MNWILFLRKCLMAELIDPSFTVGGLIRALFGIDGTLSVAEDVRAHSGILTISDEWDGHHAYAEFVLPTYGLAYSVTIFPFSGETSFPDHVIAAQSRIGFGNQINGYIPSGIFPVYTSGESVWNVIGKGRWSMADAPASTSGRIVSEVRITGDMPAAKQQDKPLEGIMTIRSGVNARLLLAYQYAVEENKAGGLTYRIRSEGTKQSGYTLQIGV